MYVIKPSTRTAWEDILIGEYRIDESTAETLVDLIVGDPRVSFSRPQNREELDAVVDTVGNVIDEIEFTDYGDVENHENLRNELVGRLRIDLGLTKTGVSEEPAASKPVGALHNKTIEELPESEPPEELQPWIDRFVEKIESEDNTFSYEQFQKITKWVEREVQQNSEK